MSRINTNVPSLVAGRILAANNAKLTTVLQRLSTGLRINSGKDDPAGLLVSEALRSDIRGIAVAIDNAHRADNVVSVAEGALQEVSALLVDLQGLVGSSANSGGMSAAEVAANQQQIDSILETVTRISSATEFNGQRLLDGSMNYTTSSVAASAISDLRINGARLAGTRTVTAQVTTSALTAKLIYAGTATGAGVTTLQIGGMYGTEVLSFGSATKSSAIIAAVNVSKALTGVSASISGAGAAMRVKFCSTDYGTDAFASVEAIGGTFTVTGGTSATKGFGRNPVLKINGITANSNGLESSLRTSTLNVDMVLTSAFATRLMTKTFGITGGGANFNIGPTIGLANTASLGIPSMATGSLGRGDVGYLSSLGSGQVNQLSSRNYSVAQRVVEEAVSQVAEARGRLGAFQTNTLGSMINSLQVALENTTAAESAIRDADFAVETSNLTRAQILVSAATSTLQIANAAPQSVLRLLQ